MQDFPHAKDHHRASYHFQSSTNWMNDPNGLVQWHGDYHLFYQYNPYGPLFGLKHWGHARSRDLVHWEHLPIALTPTPGSVDADGCWSGCFVNNNGTPTIIYSGNHAGVQRPCLATSNDADLLTWEKYALNPIIPDYPAGIEITEFRDHCLWQEEDGIWYQLIGSGIKDVGGCALLYRSSDLIHWEYMHPLFTGDKASTGTMWECPDFFPLGDKYLLTISALPEACVYYFIGTYENHRFTPETQGVLDLSRQFYAPQSIRDDQGRRLLWGWIRENRSDEALQSAGWAGAMSLPRVLSLHADQTLRVEPAPELQSLRQHHHHLEQIQLSRQPIHIGQFSRLLEIYAEFEPASAEATIQLVSPDDTSASITFNISKATDTEDATAQLTVTHLDTTFQTHVRWYSNRVNTLRIYLDGSILEMFINNHECLTQRIYPEHSEKVDLLLASVNPETGLKRLDIWELASIWPNS